MKNWNLWRCKTHSVEKRVFLTKSNGKTGYPYAKKKKPPKPEELQSIFHAIYKKYSNGSHM